MSDYPMLISNKLHSFRNFIQQRYNNLVVLRLMVETFFDTFRPAVY